MSANHRQHSPPRTLRGRAVAALLLGAAVMCAAESYAANGQVTELTGMFSLVYGDPCPDCQGEPQYVYHLSDDAGVIHELDLTPEVLSAAGGLVRLDRQRVRVKGRGVTQRVGRKLAVDEISPVGAPEGEAGAITASIVNATGSQAYVWILLRFADRPATPEPVEWFETQALGPPPSFDHYWRVASFNNINLTGSAVYGWYDLPQNRSYYVYDSDGDGLLDADLGRMREDAIAVSDADIYFPNFIGMNLIFNDTIDHCCAWGGGGNLTIDNVTRFWGTTWMPPWGWRRHGILAHEMGHALGLPHCSGPYAGTYDSFWGVMSSGDGTRLAVDPIYGSLAVHPISYHKDRLGWIPSVNRYTMGTSPTVQTVDLFNLAEPVSSPSFHMLKFPLHVTAPTEFYTVERRRMVGYDWNIPGDAVVLHHVDPSRAKPAQVVDPDGNGDCNDAGAMFMPGETFHDPANNIVITVLWADEDSSVITFTNSAFSPVYVDAANTGPENGSAAYPYNTVEEGHAAVEPNGTIYIKPGTYAHSSTRLLGRPATLRRNGTSGVVTIGTGP